LKRLPRAGGVFLTSYVNEQHSFRWPKEMLDCEGLTRIPGDYCQSFRQSLAKHDRGLVPKFEAAVARELSLSNFDGAPDLTYL